jgi:uncharacterized membrane protein
MGRVRSADRQAVQALAAATVLCAVFYAFRLWQLGSLAFSYLPWNLFLAWIPLGLTLLLTYYLRRRAWSNWPGILLTLLWLLFLPNSFYMVSDYIHLQEVSIAGALYDSIMFTMFVFTGMLLGYASLFVVHGELRRRLPSRQAAWLIALVLLSCSFAMYVGRDLRWNSWDVLASPTGLLFDVSHHFTAMGQFRDMVGTVALFFSLIAGIYYVGIKLMRAVTITEPPQF